MKVVSVLESLPGLGKVKARRLMETVGISESRRLQGLGAKQRDELLKETAALSHVIFVLIGPGGAGKGTVAAELVAQDPALWLSRSGPPGRPARGGEPMPTSSSTDATLRGARGRRAASSSGPSSSATSTARPSRTRRGRDVLLEIDLQGAEQVVAQRPDARDPAARRRRSRCRRSAWPPAGDDDEHVAAPARGGRDEEERGRASRRLRRGQRRRGPGRGRGGRYSRSDPIGCRPAPRTAEDILMAQGRHTLMDPPIEDLLDKVDSKFTLVALGSSPGPPGQLLLQQPRRGPGQVVPPQVTSVSGKPLSIAFEEIAAGKATYTRPDPEEEAAAGRRHGRAAEAGLAGDATEGCRGGRAFDAEWLRDAACDVGDEDPTAS